MVNEVKQTCVCVCVHFFFGSGIERAREGESENKNVWNLFSHPTFNNKLKWNIFYMKPDTKERREKFKKYAL